MVAGNARRETRHVERLSQAEAVSWNSRAGAGGREEASGETMARDICHAWLHYPSLTMGPGDQPVVAFFSLPSFPGTLLSLTMGLLSPPCFLPTFNPSSLLLFFASFFCLHKKTKHGRNHDFSFTSLCFCFSLWLLALSLAVHCALCMNVLRCSLWDRQRMEMIPALLILVCIWE